MIALRPREREILPLIATGLDTGELSELLHISGNTIRCYIKRMFVKFNVHNRVALCTEAIRLGILVYYNGTWNVNENRLDMSRTNNRPYRRNSGPVTLIDRLPLVEGRIPSA